MTVVASGNCCPHGPGPPAPLHLHRRRRHPLMSWIRCRWPMIT